MAKSMLVLGDDRLYAKFLPWSVMRRFAKLCWLEGFLNFSFDLCTSFKHVGGLSIHVTIFSFSTSHANHCRNMN